MNNLSALETQLDRWKLILIEPVAGATCSDVYGCVDGEGREVVLKIPHAHAEERLAIGTLKEFALHGGVQALEWDEASGAVLMPRLRPGTTLADEGLSDADSLRICADLIHQLRSAGRVSTAFDLEHFFSNLGDLPDSALVRDAQVVSASLFDSTVEKVVLHGDLHHFNILKDGDRWVAIDPKGVLGDPCFEVAAYMRNPIERAMTVGESRDRLVLFAELLRDPIERLWGWSFSQTVLCSISAPPDGNWRRTAEALHELRREFWI